MNKPIYRYLADQQWRKQKRMILMQRLTQMHVVPDFLPAIDPKVDVDLAFSRKKVEVGEIVDSAISEKMPRLKVQSFEPGQKMVTVVVVDGDVPVQSKDGFAFRCHFLASNIPISPTETSIPLTKIEHEDRTKGSEKKIAVPWLPPWSHRGAPYHRLAVFVLEHKDARALDTQKFTLDKRMDFNLRSFIDKHKLNPIGAALFRTKWDESMAGVMQRTGLHKELAVEYKRKRVEPLPYKRRTERMR
jgi:large subunit ribosomal protein L35